MLFTIPSFLCVLFYPTVVILTSYFTFLLLCLYQDSIQRTWRQMFRVSRQQYMLRFSTELDTMLQSSNADYILYWSIAQATIIILAGFIQVWTLRSFFNVKTVTPTQKPRCQLTIFLNLIIDVKFTSGIKNIRGGQFLNGFIKNSFQLSIVVNFSITLFELCLLLWFTKRSKFCFNN